MSVAKILQLCPQEKLDINCVNLKNVSNDSFLNTRLLKLPIGQVDMKRFYFEKFHFYCHFSKQYFDQIFINQFQLMTASQSHQYSLSASICAAFSLTRADKITAKLKQLSFFKQRVLKLFLSISVSSPKRSKVLYFAVDEGFPLQKYSNHSFFDQLISKE